MQSNTTTVQITLVHITASCCGAEFGLSKRIYDLCVQEGRKFYCPNCGSERRFGATENQKLTQEVERLKRSKQWAEDDAKFERTARGKAEKRLAATKGVVTRIKNRINNGVCPCCNRSFRDLERHMHTEHPNFVTTEETEST